MQSRDRFFLMITLAVVIGTMGVAFCAYKWWWKPLTEYQARIRTLEDDVDKAQYTMTDFQLGKKKLDEARLKSLPANATQSSLAYRFRLSKILKDAKLADDIKEGAKEGVGKQKIKPLSQYPNVTGVNHQLLTFNVVTHGKLKGLIKVLEDLRKMPYEQRVKRLMIEPDSKSKEDEPELKIEMDIEVLLVAGTKNLTDIPMRSDLLPPTPADRHYENIAKRDIFTGKLGPIIKKEIEYVWVDPPEDNKGKGKISPLFVPAYVRLTQNCPEDQMCFFHNRLQQEGEIRLYANKEGYDTLHITDESGNKQLLHGKLMKVEQRTIYIQVVGKVYTLELGEKLSQMAPYASNAKPEELREMGVFDMAFYEKEKAKEKKDNKGRPPRNGGR